MDTVASSPSVEGARGASGKSGKEVSSWTAAFALTASAALLFALGTYDLPRWQPLMGVFVGAGIVGSLISALIGACLLLFIVGLVKR